MPYPPRSLFPPDKARTANTYGPQVADGNGEADGERDRTAQVATQRVGGREHHEDENERDEELHAERLVVLQVLLGDSGSQGALVLRGGHALQYKTDCQWSFRPGGAAGPAGGWWRPGGPGIFEGVMLYNAEGSSFFLGMGGPQCF